MFMKKIIIVGGGVSGVIAALKASLNNSVTIIDKNDKLLKKLLLTGNGKCNYWHDNINSNSYLTTNKDLLDNILFNKDTVFEYLTDLGIYPYVKDGYYYPNSMQAATVRELLLRKLESSYVNVLLNTSLIDLKKDNNKFIIKTDNGVLECDKVILSFGGASYSKCGTDGSSFNIIKDKFKYKKLNPALTPLKVDFPYLKDWANVRFHVNASLYIDDNYIMSEYGETQFTDYGLSGINIFNLSLFIADNINKDVRIKINFLSNVFDVNSFLDKRGKNSTINDMLETVIPYQIINTLSKYLKINFNLKWTDLNINDKNKLLNSLTNLDLKVVSFLDFDRSQVTSGGILLSEINTDTFETNSIKDLYLTGELLDVTGKCGGYNLAFAFISGFIVGENINND